MIRNTRAALLGLVAAALIPVCASAQQAAPVAAQEGPAAGQAALDAGPGTVIEVFHGELLAVMKQAKDLGFDGRRERLAPAVEQAYNLRLMLRWIVGPPWDQLDEGQRDRLLGAFTRLTLATYASRFSGYSGQRFETLEEREGLRNDVLVRTEIVTDDGKKIALDYLMRNDDGRWGIVDVFYKRISELATRKSEYGSVIRRRGVDGLIAELEAKAREIEAEAHKG